MSQARRSVLAELFAHGDWAMGVVLAAAAELGDAELDRPFELGPGSIRATLRHLAVAEQVWLDRWRGVVRPGLAEELARAGVGELTERLRTTAAERNAHLEAAGEAGLRAAVHYRTLRGDEYRHPLGDLALHVANHGVHHRAQLLKMLRQLERKLSGLDFLIFRALQPTLAYDAGLVAAIEGLGLGKPAGPVTPAEFDPATLREYLRYSDWATDEVLQEASSLGDAELDRPLAIGLGTLRKTLTHMRDAEHWWCGNWEGQGAAFEALPADTSLAELRRLTRETRVRRDAFLRPLNAADLAQQTQAEVRPGVTLLFRLGESVLQLPTHGTHHRAQASNMLRQLGRRSPALDYIVWMLSAPPGAPDERS